MTSQNARNLDPLVEAARRGDEQAIRALVQQLNPRLFRVARGIVDSDAEAEDVLQQSYLLAFTRLDQYRGEAAFSTWVTRITINAARMHLRGRRNEDAYDTVSDTPANRSAESEPFEAPEDSAMRRQAGRLLRDAVSRLPEPLRLVFLLREVEDMDIREIAHDLRINPITVKTRLFRARRRLRATLEASVKNGATELFPFDGARCAAMADRVITQLREARSASTPRPDSKSASTSTTGAP